MPNIYKVFSVSIVLVILSPAVLAAENACLLEGTVTLSGKSEEVKDCIQNTGASEETLKSACKMVSDMAVAIGAPPAKTTYLSECPKATQATCTGFFGQPLTSYYYKRTKKSLDSSKIGCEMQGGKWNWH